MKIVQMNLLENRTFSTTGGNGMSCWTKEELEHMLEDVVNELDLSESAIERVLTTQVRI